MAKKLNTYVHVVERDADGNQTNAGTFGPNDEVPAWAAESITNPDVWSDDTDEDEPAEPQAAQSDSFPVVDGNTPEAQRPPTSGAGSGRDAWASYATSQEVEVTDDMDRAAIIAAVDAKQ